MKNCDEMVSSLLVRRERHNAEQKQKRKVLTQTVIPVCCICLVALIGIGIWKGGTFNPTPSIPKNDGSEYVSINENNLNSNGTESNLNASIGAIGKVKINGATYVQLSTTTKTYTPDTYLGDVSHFDFEGTFQIYDSDVSASKIFNVKEDPNILIVELENGDIMFLAKENN